jgi:hypothetical protein
LEFYFILKHVFPQTKIDLSKDFSEKNLAQFLMNLFHTFAAHCKYRVVQHLPFLPLHI